MPADLLAADAASVAEVPAGGVASIPSFDVVWEVDPPVRADLAPLRRQLADAAGIASAVLVPDNHTGRATVSSLAVAQEVGRAGHHPIACLNARDRNLLGYRRDLLTAQLAGVDDLLLVYGDEPEVGERASGLTVRTMLDECRAHDPALRVGVTTRLGPVPGWKREADRLFAQVSYDLDALLRWRDGLAYDGPVYPAVLVVPSVAMAQRLGARIPELRVPDHWLAAVGADPKAGVALAAELVEQLRESQAFAGVHLISGVRHGEVAAALGGLRAEPHPRGALRLSA